MELATRKRLRSDDNYFITLQSKIHVDQKTLDSSDSNKMKQVYNKTFNLLFNGSKCQNKNKLKPTKEEIFANVILNGSGNIKYLNNKIGQVFKDSKNSECCKKLALILSDCSNCNLKLCEFCAFSCTTCCGATLCSICILLFECGTLEEPICGRCKYMV